MRGFQTAIMSASLLCLPTAVFAEDEPFFMDRAKAEPVLFSRVSPKAPTDLLYCLTNVSLLFNKTLSGYSATVTEGKSTHIWMGQMLTTMTPVSNGTLVEVRRIGASSDARMDARFSRCVPRP